MQDNASPKKLGIVGEKIVEGYLKRKGYKILEKNYTLRFVTGPLQGEIDIIAKKDGVIVFVEVKTLRLALPWQGEPFAYKELEGRASLIDPEEKVDFHKQRKIIKTAESWLMKNKIPLDVKWQIDVISVILNWDNKKANIRHFKNAVSG